MVGAEFTLTEAYDITDVEGWIYSLSGGTAHISIYDDGGDVPTGSALFSGQFTESTVSTPVLTGLSGLDRYLERGHLLGLV